MRKIFSAFFSLASFALLSMPNLSLAQNALQEIHQERSLYRNIIVTQDSNRRCMRFTITRIQGQNQSCRFLQDSQRLVFPYAKMSLSSLLVQDNPERILIVGLGGGTLPDTYSSLFPDAEIIVSEIDDAVFRVAQEYFDFTETEKIKVDIGDARVYIKRASLRSEKFDLVILDAFNGEYIPEHLMTKEFLEEVKSLLPENGMVISNTFSTSRLYDAESVTYQQVFGEIFSIRMDGTGNRIIIASAQPLPSQEELINRAPDFQQRLDQYDMDITDYPPFMNDYVDWDTTQRPLTDQYSPANLLNN